MGITTAKGLAATAAVLVLSACSPSEESLEDAVEDKAGVIAVEARENEGDDGIPFAPIPKTVDVVMEADASPSEVLAVFDEYANEIDDGDVESVEVQLEVSKEAVLISGESIHATEPMAEDLVAAAADPNITAYRREAFPVLPGVDIRLAPIAFKDAVEVVDRYRDDEDIEFIQIVAGGFLLIRDEVNGVKGLYDARESFALEVDRRFTLTGAVITDRGPLELFVAAPDQVRLRRFVEQSAAQNLRKIVVRARDAGARRPGT